MRVAIVDYGSGNLHSVMQSLQAAADKACLEVEFTLTDHVDIVGQADRIVLPGVGAFADCAKGLRAIDGMEAMLNDRVLHGATPFLGICVGMQLMADRGREEGDTPGLGWINGVVEHIQAPGLKIPHMGWNSLDLYRPHPIFDGVDNGHAVYFVHGYHMKTEKPEHNLATVEYGGRLVAAIGRDNMVGMQFHPEKSQDIGQRLLMNWLNWKP